jgi:two-component sensor histidine kinase
VENAVRNSLHEIPSSPDALPQGWTTLRRRLMLIITVALLPIVVVSMFQGIERVRRDVSDVRAQLTTSAKNAGENYQSVFRSGEQIMRAVGSIADVRAMTGNCDSILADAMVGVSYFTNLSRVDANGTLRCSALTLAKGINIRDIGTFQDAKKANGVLVVSPLLLSRATGMKVVGSQVALKKGDGGFDGTLAVTLDLHWFDYLLRQQPIPAGVVMAVFDRNGVVLASNNPGVAPAFTQAALKAGAPDGASLSAVDKDGHAWHFGLASLIGNNIFVSYGERESRLFGQTYLHVGIDFLLPIFMILFAWVAIWIATDRQVTHWINYLRRIASAYRSGHYAIRPDLTGAPAEFQSFGDAMSEMAENIQDRDRRLRDSVNLKTTLIKEIHHRVKNNLQIVMSLLSIQANQVKDAGAREALMQAQTRINALALVHRILNELEDQSTLDLKQLLEELSRQIAEGMGETDHVRIEVDVPHMVVSSGIAVALALFTVEALTNIYKHAYPARANGVIRVSLKPDVPGKLRLGIADDGVGFQMDETGKSVGSRLIRTFGAQLGGTATVTSAAGKGTEVALIFPDPARRDEPLAKKPEAALT